MQKSGIYLSIDKAILIVFVTSPNIWLYDAV